MAEQAPIITFGTRVRKSPYFNSTKAYGCRSYSIYNHMYMPVFYQSPEEDFWAMENGVTIWDVAVERQVQITGPDAGRFTQYLTPRNLSKMAVGQCKYVLITDENGGIINDPVLLRVEEDKYWLSLSDTDVLLWAKGVALHSGMDVQITEPDVSPLQVQGKYAEDVIKVLFGEEFSDLKYYWCKSTSLDGAPMVVSRTGWTGEPGFEIFLCDGSKGDWLWEKLFEAGKPFDIKPGAPSSIRRIEAGILNTGGEMTLQTNPFEVGLDWLVDLEMEADFIGKSALIKARDTGLNRKMVGLEIAGDPIPGNENFWDVLQNGVKVGDLTSAIHSPRLKKNIGFAMLPIDLTAHGTGVEVETAIGRRAAVVTATKFYDPKNDSKKKSV